MFNISQDFINFLLVTVFAFFIGLEQRKHHDDEAIGTLFGTDRTFTLLGILGYILYVVNPQTLMPYLVGAVAVFIFLGVYYYQKIQKHNAFGVTSIIIAMITYSLAPLVYQEPLWLTLAIVVIVLIITEMKENLLELTKKFDDEEFITLAKFIVIAGIILPMLSDKPISEDFNISPYKFWLTIVAVSTISYLSYLLKKFVFPNSGTIITAILGGLYSSTATTLILARKSKTDGKPGQTAAGIITATAMMYLRLLVLAFIFNKQIAEKLMIYFLILPLVSVPFILFYIKKNKQSPDDKRITIEAKKNPLEFKTALIFGALFAFFAVITHIVVSKFGDMGVNVLSFIVGVTDIDPYILSLFQGESANIGIDVIVRATVIATASNNIIKMIYAISLGDKSIRKPVSIGFSALVSASFLLIWLI